MGLSEKADPFFDVLIRPIPSDLMHFLAFRPSDLMHILAFRPSDLMQYY